MKLQRCNDVDLALTSDELVNIQMVTECIKKIETGFNYIDTETIAGYTASEYDTVRRFLSSIFHRAELMEDEQNEQK